MGKFLDDSGLIYVWNQLKQKFAAKQDVLTSGTNIKTINNTSVLGSGNISIPKGDKGDPLTYADLTAAQKLEIALPATEQAAIAAGHLAAILEALDDLDPSLSTNDAIVTLTAQVSDVRQSVIDLGIDVESDGLGDLDVSDQDGYVLGRFENGHIRTKNFYSGDACTGVQVDNSIVSDLDIADVDGYTLGRFENGHFRTKNFYSGNVYTKDEVNSLISGGSGGGTSGGVTLQLLEQGLATKLNTLISGTNIKTINDVSLLGSGDIITSPQYIRWNGKKVGALGDSITAGYNTTKTYLEYLQDELGCTTYNYGLNSSPVHEKASSSTDSFVDRASSVRNDLDLLLILGGVNDFLWAASDFQIGDVYTISNRQLVMNTDVTSFCGAYNTMLLTLVAKLPNKQIFLMTPLHHANFGSQNVSSWRTNAAGQKLQDYVDAIKNIGQFWGLPVIDLYGESGMNPNIEASRVAFYNHYVPNSANNDSLHPDANGHKRIAETILKHI